MGLIIEESNPTLAEDVFNRKPAVAQMADQVERPRDADQVVDAGQHENAVEG